MEICIDFDGTCVTHDYPNIGKDIGAVSVLRKLIEKGHRLILFTMRGDRINDDLTMGTTLTDSVNWFKENDIPLYGINRNPDQRSWTTSTKAYAQLYIDDAALGCPLTSDPAISDRPFVDWYEVLNLLIDKGIL